jgi:hypothetical protein
MRRLTCGRCRRGALKVTDRFPSQSGFRHRLKSEKEVRTEEDEGKIATKRVSPSYRLRRTFTRPRVAFGFICDRFST